MRDEPHAGPGMAAGMGFPFREKPDEMPDPGKRAAGNS